MDKTQIHKTIRSRRAVSPIIATLLLIAIAVIGGVMIYVFTQGFFGNSAISSSPSVDTITMTGYDMREISDVTGITQHEGALVPGYGDAAGVSGMANLDDGAIYIKNVGTKSYTVSKLEVNGRVMDFNPTYTGAVAGQWGIITVPNTQTATAGVTIQTAATILPGQEGTLLVTFDNTAPDRNDSQNGRTIAVKLTSANGSVFNFNVVVGSKL